MSVIIKSSKSLREIKKEWLAHQLKKDPHFLARREFLGQTAAGVTALTFMPTIFSLMTKSQMAKADTAFAKAGVILSLPGGFSASAEAVPLDVAGNFLTVGSYRNLGVPGLDPSSSGSVSTDFGAPLWAISRLNQALQAIKSTVESRGGKIYVASGFNSNSQDDSTQNPNIASPHILATIRQLGVNFRVTGTQLNSNTEGGGRGLATASFPGMKPAVATTLVQAQDLLKVKKGAMAQMSTNSLVAAATMAKKLTDGAAKRFAAMNSGRQLAELTQAANQDLVNNVANEVALDPRLDPNIAQAFGITSATAAADSRVPLAASTKLIADGLSPLMTVQLQANFDYHDGTAGWNAAGGAHAQVMNTLTPILLALSAAKKSAAIMLATDGATSFGRDNQNAQGDANQIHGSIWIFLCMNGERPAKFSLGGMKSNDNAGGSANTDTNLNILMRGPAYEGHVLTASLLGMQGLKPEDFGVSTVSATDFAQLNLFKA